MYLGQSEQTQKSIDLVIKELCDQFPKRCDKIQAQILEQAKRYGVRRAKETGTIWATWAAENPLVWMGVGIGTVILYRGLTK